MQGFFKAPSYNYVVTFWRGGGEHDEYDDKYVETLEEARGVATSDPSVQKGKWNAKIYDRNSKIIAHYCGAYESYPVDILETDWMETIISGFGIPEEYIRAACERWLALNPNND